MGLLPSGGRSASCAPPSRSPPSILSLLLLLLLLVAVRMKGPSPPPPPPPPPPSLASSGPEVLRCGELEKRSASLLQLWKKKQVVLSRESLSLFPPEKEASWRRREGKALGLGSIAKVDCVERTGKYLYFTLVTVDRKEIDFRCPGGTGWNASIALALIDFQNQRALRRFRARRRNNGRRDPQEEGEGGEGEGEGEGEGPPEEEGGKADARMDRAS